MKYQTTSCFLLAAAILVAAGFYCSAQQPSKTPLGPPARETLSAELDGAVEIAQARMEEGTASLTQLLKTKIAVNFAQYKIGKLSEAQLREKNAPLEKRLIHSARSDFAMKSISVDEMIALIDFVSNHR